MMSSTESSVGGYKEAVVLIKGEKVYSRMKFESGVHGVQRVPATETQGRVHTSACTLRYYLKLMKSMMFRLRQKI